MKELRSAADVLYFFNNLPLEQQNACMPQLKSQFWHAINDPEMFSMVMAELDEPHRDQLFELVFEDLKNSIHQIHDFISILRYLKPAQRDTLWSVSRPLDIHCLTELAQVFELLDTEHYVEVLQNLPPFQKTGLELGLLLGMLSPSQRRKLHTWINSIIPELYIVSSEDFHAVMQYFDDIQKCKLFDRVWLMLPSMIDSSHAFSRIFEFLTRSQADLLILSINLSHLCHNTAECLEMMQFIPKKHIKSLYLSLPEDANQWGILLGELPMEKAELLMNKLPQKFYSGESFAQMQMFLDAPARQQLFILFYKKLSLLLKNGSDLVSCFTYLNTKEKESLLTKCANNIFHWLNQDPILKAIFREDYPEFVLFLDEMPNAKEFASALLSRDHHYIREQFKELLKLGSPLDIISHLSVFHPKWTPLINKALCLKKATDEEHFKQLLRKHLMI